MFCKKEMKHLLFAKIGYVVFVTKLMLNHSMMGIYTYNECLPDAWPHLFLICYLILSKHLLCLVSVQIKNWTCVSEISYVALNIIMKFGQSKRKLKGVIGKRRKQRRRKMKRWNKNSPRLWRVKKVIFKFFSHQNQT